MKETATTVFLGAALACLASLLPLGLMLLRTRFFSSLQTIVAGQYSCPWTTYLTYAGINGLLMWLYLPLIFVLFGIHIYVIPIDKAFPMMMVNGIVWWFFWINVIGFFIFMRWFKKQSKESGLTLNDISIVREKFINLLTGVFHPRIQYPQQEDEQEKEQGDEDRVKQPAPSERKGRV